MARPPENPRGARGTQRGRARPQCCVDSGQDECEQHRQERWVRERRARPIDGRSRGTGRTA